MKIQKTLALAMLALGIVGVSACGKVDDPGTGGGTVTPSPGPDTPTPDTPTPSDPLKDKKDEAKQSLQSYIDDKLNSCDPTYQATAEALINEAKIEWHAEIDMADTEELINSALTKAKAKVDKLVIKPITAEDTIEVGNVEKFKEMLLATTGTWKLTADIDLTNEVLPASTARFGGTIDGQGHKITFNGNVPASVAKTNGLLYKGLRGATIKNVEIVNPNINGAEDVVSIFGDAINATIQNVSIKNAKATFIRYSGLLLSKCAGIINIENVAATGFEITAGDYSGGLIGDYCTPTDVQSEGEAVANAKLTIKNVLVDGDYTSASGSQCAGLVVGFVDDKGGTDYAQPVEIDGAVVNGSIKGGKNIGAVVGSYKKNASPVGISVKNVLTLDLTVTANTVAEPFSDTKVGIAWGLSNGTSKVKENIVSVEKATKIIADKDLDGISDADTSMFLETVVKPNEVVAPTSAFSIANGKIALGTLGEVTLPVAETEAAVENGTISDGNTGDEAVGTADGQAISFTGNVGYYHKAGAAGFAGNAVEVKIEAASGVDTTGATLTLNEKTSAYNSGDVIYVPVTDLSQTTTISVKWNENAIAQEYTVKFANEATKEAAPVYGTIENVTEGLTAAMVEDVYTYQTGTISWNAEENGNAVSLKIAKPEWVASTADATVQGGKVTAREADHIIVLANVKATETAVKVQWTNITDPKTYNIAVGAEVTLETNPNAQNVVVLDASLLTAETTGYTENTPLGDSGIFTALVGDATKLVRVDGAPQRINLSKGRMTATTNCIQIDLTKKAVIKAVACSSKKIAENMDTTIKCGNVERLGRCANDEDATTYELDFGTFEAGTYTIGGKAAGCYIYSITIEYID